MTLQFEFRRFVDPEADPKHLAEEDHDSLMRAGVNLRAQFEDFLNQLRSEVETPALDGVGVPNLLNNGNFLPSDGTPEAPGYLPPFWDSPWVSDGMVASYGVPPAPPAGQPGIPGQFVQIPVVGGGNPRWIVQRIQGSNRKSYSPGFYYRTTSGSEGARVVFSNTAGTVGMRARDLPPTGGAFRYYPAYADEPLTIGVGEFGTSPYLSLTLGSVNAPTVTQDISFAGVSVSEGARPILWKPSALDQGRCQGNTPPANWTPQNLAGAPISPGMVVGTPPGGVGVLLANAGVGVQGVGLMIRPAAASGGAVAANRQGIVQTTGIVDAGDWGGDWTAATGAATLTPGPYYLDTVSGKLTPTKPAAPNIGQPIGRAVGPTRLALGIGSDENALASSSLRHMLVRVMARG